MQNERESSVHAYRWWIRGAAALFVAAMVVLAVMNLPRGFDTDLTKIGTGIPALVFVYDPNLVISNKQTEEMDKVRNALEDAMLFLVADVGRADAQQFMQKYSARVTEILLFHADGSLVKKSQSLMASEDLITLYQESIAR